MCDYDVLFFASIIIMCKKEEIEKKGADTKMLRWFCGVTRLDRIRNEYMTEKGVEEKNTNS